LHQDLLLLAKIDDMSLKWVQLSRVFRNRTVKAVKQRWLHLFHNQRLLSRHSKSKSSASSSCVSSCANSKSSSDCMSGSMSAMKLCHGHVSKD
jgi:hypothetical protein